jgi:hypothetical protein
VVRKGSLVTRTEGDGMTLILTGQSSCWFLIVVCLGTGSLDTNDKFLSASTSQTERDPVVFAFVLQIQLDVVDAEDVVVVSIMLVASTEQSLEYWRGNEEHRWTDVLGTEPRTHCCGEGQHSDRGRGVHPRDH